ncbi:MAG TPA: glycosyltransferase [Gemmataceae bacterium]|nr:glycosyltransferase [Gemmataceae bacterium]
MNPTPDIMGLPVVTAIIPTFNSAHFLPNAVDSVLAQSVSDVEVLVVDDGSTDGTPDVLSGYGSKVRGFRQENTGVAVARNRGLAEARGRYVAFLDADDTWEPQKLERQLAALAGSSCRASYTAYTAVTAALAPVEVRRFPPRGPVRERLLCAGNVIGTPSTVLAERDLFAEVGGFDPALSQCADWDMWVRLSSRTDFLYVDEPLVRYRVHDGNMSRNLLLLEADSERVLAKAFAAPDMPAGLRARRRAALAYNAMVLAGSYLHAANYRAAARCLVRSLMLDPARVGYAAAFPARILNRWTARRQPAGRP